MHTVQPFGPRQCVCVWGGIKYCQITHLKPGSQSWVLQLYYVVYFMILKRLLKSPANKTIRQILATFPKACKMSICTKCANILICLFIYFYIKWQLCVHLHICTCYFHFSKASQILL